MRHLHVPPELLIIGAALSVQFGAGTASTLLRDHSPITVVALRLVLGAALLTVVRRPRAPVTGRRGWRNAALLALVFVGMNSAFYLALSRIPLGVAVTLEFWGPLAVAIAGSRRLRDVVWVVLAAIGIWILAGGQLGADDPLGVGAALAAGAGWALFIIVGSRVGHDWPDGRGLNAALLMAAVLVAPLALLAGDGAAVLSEPGTLWGGLVIAAFSSAIPWSLELRALRRLPGRIYGVLTSVEPAFAALVGFLLLDQLLHPIELLAIALVAVASAGASITARRLSANPGELEAA
jgi:inner membrane transporter RhtA